MGMAATVGGLVLQGFNAFGQANMARQQAELEQTKFMLQKEQSEQNAVQADIQGREELRAGLEEAANVKEQVGLMIAANRANAASSGMVMDVGSVAHEFDAERREGGVLVHNQINKAFARQSQFLQEKSSHQERALKAGMNAHSIDPDQAFNGALMSGAGGVLNSIGSLRGGGSFLFNSEERKKRYL